MSGVEMPDDDPGLVIIPGINAVTTLRPVPLPSREVDTNNPLSLAAWRRQVLPLRGWTKLDAVESGDWTCQWCGDRTGGKVAFVRHHLVKRQLNLCRTCCLALAGDDGKPGCEPPQTPERRTRGIA